MVFVNGLHNQYTLKPFTIQVLNSTIMCRLTFLTLHHCFLLIECTRTGDLRIVRIDQVSGCCTGKEVIFIFVEKVDKSKWPIIFTPRCSSKVGRQ